MINCHKRKLNYESQHNKYIFIRETETEYKLLEHDYISIYIKIVIGLTNFFLSFLELEISAYRHHFPFIFYFEIEIKNENKKVNARF